jgi:4-amino-4-deoxy-L-arabinose transferase-like glycosyltransferase
LIVAALWYGPVIAKHGYSFIDQFFIQHHFARYISNKYKHPQRFYFYFTIILLLALPWSGALIESLVRTRAFQWRSEDPLNKTRTFALAWLALPILFFSFSGSKLPGYILPALPATALLVGDLIDTGRSRWTMRITGLMCLALAITGIVFTTKSGAVSLANATLITSPMVLGGIIAIRWSQARFWSVIVVGGVTVLTLVLVLNSFGPKFAEVESVRNLLRRADARGYSNLPVFARSADDRSAEFYASGHVVYDSTGEPVMLEKIPEMQAEAKARGPILIVVPADYVDIVRRMPDMEIIGTNGRVALIKVISDK